MFQKTPVFQDHLKLIEPYSVGFNQHRLIWAMTRSFLEADVYKVRKYGKKLKRHWSLFEILIAIFGKLIRMTPLYDVGLENAKHIEINQLTLSFENLPESFDGYSILHMTDLHLDFIPGMDEAICKLLNDLEVDLCVVTGDFRAKTKGGFKNILHPLQRVVGCVRARDGIFATLGNHDSYQMVSPFEQMGMTVLANETVAIDRMDDRIWLTGLDDPYYYYTDQAIRALEETPNGFKIALVHTPSLYDVASENGYSFYLCGHTHGGQICLPGGRAIIVHLRHGRRFYRGLWRFDHMIGYTGQGTGTVGIPLRFNTQSEITLFRLKQGKLRN